jgi:type II secretory pathway pseudopilin PulG
MPTAPTRPFFARPAVLETLVALSVLVALSGVVLPVVSEGVATTRITGAHGDLQLIAEGLARYVSDTHVLPTGVEGRTNITLLYGPGHVPASQRFGATIDARPLEDALLNPSMARARWHGPYAAALHADPWGNAYLVNADGWVEPGEQAMVLSAGPDGVVQTTPWARRPAGDDLLLAMD